MMKGKKDPKEVWDSIAKNPNVKEDISEILWNNIDQRILKKECAKKKVKKSILLILPVLLLGVWYGLRTKEQLSSYTFQTLDNRDTILLQDGSRIMLEPFSKVVVSESFAIKDRKVTFQGKGYFDIAKDPSKPFRIDAKDFDVEVLGTKFQLTHTVNEHFVKLFEGKVKINRLGKITYLMREEAWRIASDASEKHYVLPTAKKVFKFDHAKFTEVLKQLGESYQIEVDYPDSVKDKIVSGSFNGNFEDILQIIAFPLNLKPTRINEQKYSLK